MAAVAGILATDLLGLPKWYEAGAQQYGIPPIALLAIMAPVMGFLETKRLNGFLATGKSGFMDSFPFDPMGQSSSTKELNEVRRQCTLQRRRLSALSCADAVLPRAQVKNGRLAMVAFVGFATQALVTRTGPLENLSAHLRCVRPARAPAHALRCSHCGSSFSNPFGNNIIGSIASLPQTLGQ